jgi:tetratricopeptide (TPR) repeat protein
MDVLGSAFSSLGQPARALEQMEQGIAIKLELGDQIGQAIAWANIACIHKRSGDARRAIDLYEKWLVPIRAAGDLKAISLAAINLGECYLHVGRIEQAVNYSKKLDCCSEA